MILLSVVLASDVNDELIVFTKDQKSLRECIENRESFKLMNHFMDHKTIKSVTETVAGKFFGLNNTIKEFDSILDSYVTYLRKEREIDEWPWTYFKMSLREALVDCSDNMPYRRLSIEVARNQLNPEDPTPSGLEDHQIRFNNGPSTLAECIENHQSVKVLHFFLGERLIKNIVETIDHRFAETNSNTLREINSFLDTFVEELSKNYVSSSRIQIPWEEIKKSLVQALTDCSEGSDDKGVRKNKAELNDQYDRRDIPRSHYEPGILGLLIDYILVNWPDTLRNMIGFRSGRALLRLYVDDALIIFEEAYLEYCQKVRFDLHFVVNNIWSLRAAKYFDARDLQMPYIDHVYTADYPIPHTHGRLSMFDNRLFQNVCHRDGLAPNSCIENLLNTYAPGSSYSQNRDNAATDRRYSMRTTKAYFEIRRQQFYRLLCFFLKLREYGISTDADDIWDGPIPFDVVPEDVQEIVYNDGAYSEYLSTTKWNLLTNYVDPDNTHLINRQHLANSQIVSEEDLVHLLIAISGMRDFTTSSTTSTTSTTISSISTSTTIDYEESKRGKGKFIRLGDKCYPLNRYRYFKRDKNDRDGSSSGGPKKSASFHQHQVNNYGYIVDTDDFYKLPTIENSSAMKILKDMVKLASMV